eukprot:5552891-Amphidinium_carterae.1
MSLLDGCVSVKFDMFLQWCSFGKGFCGLLTTGAGGASNVSAHSGISSSMVRCSKPTNFE